jgi:uncharacterized protein YnzC (UPF0291/DUF896 family)
MEINGRKVGSFEITTYYIGQTKTGPKIIIEKVKVLDTEGNYIKFAKLEGVISYLNKYPVVWK